MLRISKPDVDALVVLRYTVSESAAILSEASTAERAFLSWNTTYLATTVRFLTPKLFPSITFARRTSWSWIILILSAGLSRRKTKRADSVQLTILSTNCFDNSLFMLLHSFAFFPKFEGRNQLEEQLHEKGLILFSKSWMSFVVQPLFQGSSTCGPRKNSWWVTTY